MSVTMCLECKHRVIIEDNHGQYHSICSCCESENFLEQLCSVFDRCEHGELEFNEDEELMPCKCGCEAELVSSQTFAWCDVKWYVQCVNPDCEERTPRYEHKCDAINDWNRRAMNDNT